MAALVSTAGASGWKLRRAAGTSCRGAGGRHSGSDKAAKVASVPGAIAAQVRALRTREASPRRTLQQARREQEQFPGTGLLKGRATRVRLAQSARSARTNVCRTPDRKKTGARAKFGNEWQRGRLHRGWTTQKGGCLQRRRLPPCEAPSAVLGMHVVETVIRGLVARCGDRRARQGDVGRASRGVGTSGSALGPRVG